MKTDQFSSMNDIIFEKRNKRYGAYELRKNYHRRLFKSFVVASVSLVTVILVSRISKDSLPKEFITERTDTLYISDPFVVEQTSAPKPPDHFTPPPQTYPDEFAYVPVTDSMPEQIDSTTSPDTQLLANASDSGNTSPADSTGTTANQQGGFPSLATVHNQASVDVRPDFPGGLEKFYSYLKSRIRYTHEARGEGAKGRLYAKFIVDEEGFIRSVTIVKGLGYGLDEQVAKVLEESPKWTPGIVRNTAVKTEMILPVNFDLQ